MTSNSEAVQKLPTGIAGFDEIANGGLPAGRSTVLSGTSGSGKTVFAFQFLVAGARDFGQNGVFVTFEEAPHDLMANVRSFGWNLEALIEQHKIAFVDATAEPGTEIVAAGSYDLSALLARIENAIREVGAKRVSLDAVGTLFPQVSDATVFRREIHRIHWGLRKLGVTTLITTERKDDDGCIERSETEEFVADSVMIVRNRLEHDRRRRTIEILKFRGGAHRNGEFPFTIEPAAGVTIVPLSTVESEQKSSGLRVSLGVRELDRMCGGGPYRDSMVLVSGETGTGKTLLVTEYIKAGIQSGDKALLVGTEESREQLTRNAASWGMDLETPQQNGQLRIVCGYPESTSLDELLLQLLRDLSEFGPARVAVDSISAFQRVSSSKSLCEFIIALTSEIKRRQITGLFTSSAAILSGREPLLATSISTISDAIILLRHVELWGEMRRALAVLKMRGTHHDKEVREFSIDGTGMQIKGRFRGVHGILTGLPRYTFTEDDELVGPPVTDR